MGREFHVYGIGNAVVDLQFRISEQQFASLNTEKSTMRLVTAEEQDELLSRFKNAEIDWSAGGSVANSVIALAQLGGRGAFGTVVGNDGFGEFFLEEMDDLGVSLHNQPTELLRTSTSAIMITPDAERTMRTYLGASSEIDAQHIDEAYIAQSEWLLVEGYLLMQEAGRRAVKRAVEFAKRHGTLIALTTSEAFVVHQHPEAYNDVAKEAELIFCNLNEGEAITQQQGGDAVFDALKQRFPNFALTLSAEGARIFVKGEEARIPGFQVKAIDETGAGDMFAGSFLYGLTTGMPIEKLGQLSCFLASQVVSQLGARLQVDVRELAESEGLSLG